MRNPPPPPDAFARSRRVTPPAAMSLLPQDPATQMSLWLTAAALRICDWVAREHPALGLHHPFLEGYRAAAEAALPGVATTAWPAHLISRETHALPFARTADTLALTDTQRLAFALVALAEEDARVGAFLVEAQGGGAPYPSIETLARVLSDGPPVLGAGWDLAAPLIAAGLLIPTEKTGPRARQTLAPEPLAWDLIRGAALPAWPRGVRLSTKSTARKCDGLAYNQSFRDQLTRVPAAIAAINAPLIVLRHMPGADIEEISASLALAMDRNLLIAGAANNENAHARTIGAAAILCDAIPLLSCDLGPGETLEPPELGRWIGPVILSMGQSGGLDPLSAARAITLAVPFPRATDRARAWLEAFEERPVTGMEEIRDGFQLPLGYVRRAGRAAASAATLAGRATITPSDVQVAARALGREQLDGLAEFMPASDGWGELIAPGQTKTLLDELCARCKNRERLPRHLGTARDGSAGRGVRALFTGASGTGKTLAARLLGGAVGTDVYRLNLAAVVDKFVGETEKRMDQILAQAEALDVILLADEGDGLLAQRTDVRSSNDRFANLETNFLLQRLESHEGIVVVTTNAPDNIDSAFQRRMDVVVPFPRPSAEARLALWELHLPDNHAVDPARLRDFSTQAALTGGQIRNAVRAAASIALSEGGPIDAEALRRGLERELQKAGAMGGLAPGRGGSGAQTTRLSAFAKALNGEGS